MVDGTLPGKLAQVQSTLSCGVAVVTGRLLNPTILPCLDAERGTGMQAIEPAAPEDYSDAWAFESVRTQSTTLLILAATLDWRGARSNQSEHLQPRSTA